MTELDTIVALATPRMTSALAIIRLSGSKTLSILEHIQKKKAENIIPNQSFFANIYEDISTKEKPIDQAVITFYKGPKSYTGEDTAEFSIHGSPLIADALMNACVKWGARPAQRGEYSLKAFLNNKLGLLEAEGVNNLINAKSTLARSLALQAVKGKTEKQIEDIKNTLLYAISEAEYLLEDDYSDHPDYMDTLHKVQEDKIYPLIKNIEELESKANNALKAYNGIKVAIVGKPNVGKSTLLNALVGEEKAIVTPIPGTTRDIIEGDTEINGIQFHFFDTAGIHETNDEVEKIGVERALNAINTADLILLVSPSSFENKDLPSIPTGKKVIKIGSKSDLGFALGADVEINAKDGQIEELKNRLIKEVSLSSTNTDNSFMSERDLSFLIKVKDLVIKANHALDNGGLIDAFSDDLRRAVALANEMLGLDMRSTEEDIYNTIFSRFCLGK